MLTEMTRGLAAAACVLALASCEPVLTSTLDNCNPASCSGCCNSGRCEPGSANGACGGQGLACVVCPVNTKCRGATQQDLECRPLTDVGIACSTAEPCPSPLTCLSSLPGGYCIRNACPCSQGEVCIAGVCRKACINNTECRSGYMCSVAPGTSLLACAFDCRTQPALCPSGTTCQTASGLCG
jgi:hypothetical protein